MIFGDMNVCTTSSGIIHDDVKYLPLCETYNNMYKRNNHDDKGNELIGFGISNQLRIINGVGRCIGELLGITHVLTHTVKAQ